MQQKTENWEEPFVIRPPERAAFPPFVQYSGENALLTIEECESIIANAESAQFGYGTIGNGGNDTFHEDLNYRCTKVRALWRDRDELGWLYERLRDRVMWTNDEYFRFDLTGFNEGMQYLRYDIPAEEKPAGHYNWHQDFGGGYSSHRKLSVVIQLSNPADYEGCRLQLFTDRAFDVPCVGQGDAIIFPSWLPHRVTNIKTGIRRSIACWVSGPQFR